MPSQPQALTAISAPTVPTAVGNIQERFSSLSAENAANKAEKERLCEAISKLQDLVVSTDDSASTGDSAQAATDPDSVRESIAKVVSALRRSNDDQRKELEARHDDLMRIAQILTGDAIQGDLSSDVASHLIEQKVRELKATVEGKEHENQVLRASVENLERAITASCSESPEGAGSDGSSASLSAIEQITERVSALSNENAKNRADSDRLCSALISVEDHVVGKVDGVSDDDHRTEVKSCPEGV